VREALPAAIPHDVRLNCFLYEKGAGVAQDFKAAASWYAKSAAQGDAVSQCNLGFLYENGMGVAQDLKAAAL